MEVIEKISNIENNLLNRTVMREIDKHQMAMYELMKSVFPEMTGFKALTTEETEGDKLDIVTRFYMIRPENDDCDEGEEE